MEPIIKWAGGKRQLLPIIKEMMPEDFNNYYEPFIGGGALLFGIEPQHAVINDFNIQLSNLYYVVKRNLNELKQELDILQARYNSIEDQDGYYYERRDEYNEIIDESSIRSAALFIFLNKAGFNGLYRVNRNGKFNVPSAHRKKLKLYDNDNLNSVSELLQNVNIKCGDFERACRNAQAGDFVFFDSPYYDTFDTYQAGGFSEEDHRRLFNLFVELTNKGVYCMMTNSNTDFIKDLYQNYNIKVIPVKRMINRDATNRTGEEIIVTNYDYSRS